MAYLRLVLRRAVKDTALFDGRRIVTSIVVALVALGFQFGLHVRELPATMQIGGTVVGAYMLVALVSFVWNLSAAPARIHTEQESVIRELRVVRATEDALNALMDYRDEGINLQATGPGLDSKYLESWIASHDAWKHKTVEFLKSKFPRYQWARFATIGSHGGGQLFEGMDDTRYQAMMAQYDMEIHRLDDIRNETMASKLFEGGH